MKNWGFYIGRQLIRMLLLMAAVSMASFFLMKASPVDPLQANVGQAALGTMSREQVEKLRAYWGTDLPPVQQYLSWAKDFMQGEMGTSLLYRRPVASVIREKLENSLFLLLSAWLLSGILGTALGVLAGMHRGSILDQGIKGYCILIAATPTFWLALLLLLLFGVWWKILPIGLSVPIGMEAASVTFLDRIRHAILPVLTLTLTGVSNITLHTREKMIDIMESDYMLFARAKGETKWEMFWNHGFRNVLLPAITLQFASISEIIGGSVLVEQVFSYPGMGQAMVAAGLGSDLPLLMAVTMISALFVFCGNLTADLLYHIVDPRIRRSGVAS